MGKLDGKVAMVTGAGRGLGRSYAKRVAALGAKVAVTDVDLKSYREFEAEAQSVEAASTIAEIEAIGGIALGFEMDVTDRQAVERTVGQIRDAWGRIDILVANAGGGRGQPDKTKASTLDPELLDFVVRTNLFGTIHCCTAVAAIMKEQRAGKIITVGSIAGSSPSREGIYAHYGATKAAIAHYTRFLAQDVGPFGITANCIAPGLIATGRIMQNVLPGNMGPGDPTSLISLRRLGTVDDCSNVIEFLATDLSDYVNGAVIPVDGGIMR